MAFNPYASSKARGEKSGGFRYLDTDKPYYKIEKEGSYALDVIPYKIGTKNHPSVVSGEAEVGDTHYVLDFFIHRNIGPKKQAVICPNRTFGRKCPVCEQYEEIKKEKGWDSDEAKALAPQHRVCYNIVDHDDIEKGVMLFDTSYAYFEKEALEQAAQEGPEEGLDYIPFGNNGKDKYTIKFRATMERIGKNEFPKYKNFTFKKVKDGELDGLMKKAASLDTLMILKNYEEISQIMYGAPEEDEDDEKEATPPKRQSKRDEDDEEESKGKSDALSCPDPHGKFGDPEYHDELKACRDCDIWTECRAATKAAR